MTAPGAYGTPAEDRHNFPAEDRHNFPEVVASVGV
jgi:hypothetical protein